MPRNAALWRRKDRPGWWATIGGKQTCFGEDRKEAEKAFHAAKARAEPAKPGGRMAVHVAVQAYLDDIRGKVAAKTLRNKRHALQLWVDARGRLDLAALQAEHLEAWLERPAWNPSTRHAYGSAVKTWARWCVRRRLLAASPFAAVRLPGILPRRAAPAGTLERVLAAASPALRDFLTVLIETGCRPGEVRTLTASRIDQDRSTAIVEGKTGERLIGLTDRVLRLLEPLLRKHPTGPLLRTPRGKEWTEDNLKSTMRDLRKRLGIRGVVPYSCRHAFWGRATKAGVGDVAIAMQMGHSDLKMIAKHYAHADHEIMRETARKAAGES